MEISEIKKLTPYRDINDIIVLFLKGLKKILGNNLVGLYLTGSLSYGDFVRERSDLDLQAIVKEPLSRKDLESVKNLHIKIENKYKKWAKRIECSYLPVNLLHEILPPKIPRPWWGAGVFYPEAPYGNEWIINQYQLYNHGIALFGPDFKTLTKPIDIKEIQKACVRDLFQEWEPKIRDSDWLENSHYQSYLVLNLCRILYTVICGDIGSKKISANWVKSKYPEWKNLIETAEKWHYGIEMKEKEKVIELIKFTIDKAKDQNIL